MNDSFLEYLTDQFSFLGPISIKKMFGGAGIYLDGAMFALVADEEVYLKVNAETKPEFEAAGMEPFIYEGKKGKPIKMSYHRISNDMLDEQDQLRIWAEKAVIASQKK